MQLGQKCETHSSFGGRFPSGMKGAGGIPAALSSPHMAA